MECKKTQDKNDLKEFFLDGNPLPKEDFKSLKSKTKKYQHPSMGELPEHISDVQNLSKTALRTKYLLTYQSWANMKTRCKKGLGILGKEFEDFADFLTLIGPRQKKEDTLDRTDNNNPLYGAENVRWENKHSQNINKSNNVFLIHENGEKHTISEWAEITGQKRSTLYKRKSLGWSDMAIITGENVKKNPLSDTPWPYDKREAWESRYQKNYRKSKCLNRMEFLYLESKRLYEEAKERAAELSGCLLSEVTENEALDFLERKVMRYKLFMEESGKQIDYERRKKEFVYRPGAGSASSEATLFEAVNKKPVFNINKKFDETLSHLKKG